MEIKELQIKNTVIQDPKDIATALNVYFIDSVTHLTQSPGPEVRQVTQMPLNTEAPIFTIHTVSQSQFDKVICGLKSSRAKDAYGMNTLFLKTPSPLTNYKHY